jgi:hypothetical protein
VGIQHWVFFAGTQGTKLNCVLIDGDGFLELSAQLACFHWPLQRNHGLA